MDNNTPLRGIPLDAITKGRGLEDVLTAYMITYKNAHKVVATPGKSVEYHFADIGKVAELFADAMQGAVYRLYLLGVEDGMRRE